eukprot:4791879-Prymnesium_polylepis.4
MLDIERKLDSVVESSAFSQSAGGVITNFLLSFGAVACWVVPQFLAADDSLDSQWRLRATLYFAKMVLGLFSLPFIVFQIPVIKDALTHTKKTAYDRAGKCVPMLPKAEKQHRYAMVQRQRLHRQHAMLAGERVGWGEWLELKWNAFLGFPEFDKKKVSNASMKKPKGLPRYMRVCVCV